MYRPLNQIIFNEIFLASTDFIDEIIDILQWQYNNQKVVKEIKELRWIKSKTL